LLEARAERVVEMRAAEIKALAAQEFETRRAARDRKTDRERAVGLGVPCHARRVDADLVGKRPQCREDPRAAHDNAGIGLADNLQRRPFLEIEDAGNRTAALQVDQRMGEGQVVFADVFVIAPHVLGKFRAPVFTLREIIRRPGPPPAPRPSPPPQGAAGVGGGGRGAPYAAGDGAKTGAGSAMFFRRGPPTPTNSAETPPRPGRRPRAGMQTPPGAASPSRRE